MSTDRYQKVTADHLRRDAFLYVRQSSLRKVFENTESTKRQSVAETAMYRVKQLFGGHLTLRDYDAQI